MLSPRPAGVLEVRPQTESDEARKVRGEGRWQSGEGRAEGTDA